MKKLFKAILFALSICLFTCVTKTANAQFSAGARAGANFATEPANGLYHVFLARPYVGIFGQYQLAAPLGLQLGVNYSGEGANYKDEQSGDTYQIRHAFLTIPLMLQYEFSFGGYIEAGAQYGFLLSAKERANSDAFADSKQYYKGTDASAGVGLGYEFKGNALAGFGLSARYMRGLTAFNKYPLEDGSNVKSRVLSVGLTYRFESKK
jgi:hypothetical protein